MKLLLIILAVIFSLVLLGVVAIALAVRSMFKAASGGRKNASKVYRDRRGNSVIELEKNDYHVD